MNATAATPYAGDKAALVIRALLDFRSLWTTHDLVTTSGVPAQSVRRIVDRLEQEELVERRAPGVVTVPGWLALLRRWNEDFRFTRTTRLTYWRTKPGARPVLDRIPTTPIRHALTGTQAARHWSPETPSGPTVIYTPDAQAAAIAWELVPAKTGSIVLAEPAADVVYTRARKTSTGLRLAAPSQVLADLLTGAATSPRAADPLSQWMQEHELDWRY
ncbi:MarR family transcriptional regulator [Kribbella sp. NPDC051586]|uniref:MarR family transcriptional regulator n=1 Tax=Kribbella sp. NPDC051586 TaxID=3364118 RepID=UPI00379FC6F4